MTTAVLAGVGATVPPRVVTNHDLASRLDTSDEWIRQRTGIAERRVVDNGLSTGDLATEAGMRALKNAGISSVDQLILATTTPDRPCPATAPTVASRMGLEGIPAFDIAAVCSGFLYALQMGAATISAGHAASVLVIGAESFSTILDPHDRTTAAIFGDGAGAMVLRRGAPEEDGALLAFDAGSDGSLADLITVRSGGAEQRSRTTHPDPYDAFFRMQGKEVYLNAVRRMTESSRAVTEKAGWSISDIDRFVGHQANKRIIHTVAEQLDIDLARAVLNIEHVGNTAAASIPLALVDSASRDNMHPGDRTVLTAFGGGATWASVALTWPEIDTPTSPME